MSLITENDYHRIALILVEALFYGDAKAAHNHGVTTRTLRNYRKLMSENENISLLFQEKRKEFESNWSSNLSTAIIAGIEFLACAAKTADRKDASTIEAITNAVRTLTEISLTKEMIDAKVKELGYDREIYQNNRQIYSKASIQNSE